MPSDVEKSACFRLKVVARWCQQHGTYPCTYKLLEDRVREIEFLILAFDM